MDENLRRFTTWKREINGHIDFQLEAGRSYELLFRGHRVREVMLRQPFEFGLVRLLCGMDKETEYAIFIPLSALEIEFHQVPLDSDKPRVGFRAGDTDIANSEES